MIIIINHFCRLKIFPFCGDFLHHRQRVSQIPCCDSDDITFYNLAYYNKYNLFLIGFEKFLLEEIIANHLLIVLNKANNIGPFAAYLQVI